MIATPAPTADTSDAPWPTTWQPPRAADVLLSPQDLRPVDLAQWLDEQERDVAHPLVVQEGMRRAGWHPAHAALEAARYRSRFDEHRLGYSALLVSTGVAAFAAGTAGHALAAGIDRRVNRDTLATWLTILVVSLPFAIWAHVWAAHVDRDDPVAVWSQPRRSLARALVWGCGIVGIGRLVMYAAQLIGALVGAHWASGDSAGAGAVNVAITVGIALPLGLWAFNFLHRFDAEDPAVPNRRTRGHR
ncbi:MAG: hypothetical protein QOJ52_3383 [Acidimicrobiaceae bacterium]|nr:hypothetical protein [Acidimicrobiaceae bacterium]MDQ1421421.1 hypothetical protein [Acidimicrobiaceae bacterium]